MLQIWYPEFHPEASLWRKALGSRDISVMVCGFATLGVLLAAYALNSSATKLLPRVYNSLQIPWVIKWLAIFLLSWAYLTGMGYMLGRSHGKTAIWEGKMGTRWVKHNGSWWVFVVRANGERNFIFDRVKHQTKAIKDGEIEEWDGPVTKDPK
jgi:hypothetical protein